MAQADFDAIVVGAGAGGAAAAYFLVQAGLRVLVVEQARLPRYKACGGAIPRQALERFPFSFDAVIQAAPSAVRFTFPGLPPVDVPLPDRPVVMVMRSEFDAFLLARSGAEVMQGAAVTAVVEEPDGVQVWMGDRLLTARYLVGADGAASLVARWLGLRSGRRLGGSLEAEVPLDGSQAWCDEVGQQAVFSLGIIPWGYAWVFPKGDHLSVGIARLRQGRVDLHEALQREAGRLGIRLDGLTLHGHPLPYYRAPGRLLRRGLPQERLSTRRCLLVGDAAGLVDPFLGEGIRYAISSARLAAEAIAHDDLAGYEGVIWREIGHSLAIAGLTAGFYYSWPRLVYRLGVRNPAAVQCMVDVLVERFSYEGIGRRLFAATAGWIFRRRKDEG